jgi:integral membrane sensor domain MASE1
MKTLAFLTFWLFLSLRLVGAVSWNYAFVVLPLILWAVWLYGDAKAEGR